MQLITLVYARTIIANINYANTSNTNKQMQIGKCVNNIMRFDAEQ